GKNAIVQNADLHEDQQHHRHFEAQSHAKHEFRDELDVILRFPDRGGKPEPVGIHLGSPQSHGHEEEITKGHACHEQHYRETKTAIDVMLFVHLEGGENELRNEIKDEG